MASEVDEWTTITIRRATKKKMDRVARQIAEELGQTSRKLSYEFVINYLIKVFEESKGKGAAPEIEAAPAI